jgi:hypothetical protein
MPFEEGLCLAEDVEDLFLWEFHRKALSFVD